VFNTDCTLCWGIVSSGYIISTLIMRSKRYGEYVANIHKELSVFLMVKALNYCPPAKVIDYARKCTAQSAVSLLYIMLMDFTFRV